MRWLFWVMVRLFDRCYLSLRPRSFILFVDYLPQSLHQLRKGNATFQQPVACIVKQTNERLRHLMWHKVFRALHSEAVIHST
jgi:hypothetical protein